MQQLRNRQESEVRMGLRVFSLVDRRITLRYKSQPRVAVIEIVALLDMGGLCATVPIVVHISAGSIQSKTRLTPGRRRPPCCMPRGRYR